MRCILIGMALILQCESSEGQSTTFTYDPAVSGSNTWTNSAKWGLPSGYPSEDGTVINLRRVASTTTLSLGITSVTIGKINAGSAGTGTGQWTINSSGGVITLDNSIWGEGVFPAELNALNGALRIEAQMVAEKGVSIAGNFSTQIFNTDTVLKGGISIAGSGGAYFGHASNVNQSNITIKGSGGVRFGNATATSLEVSSDFITENTNAGFGANITNSSTLTVSGNISGTGGVRFFSENTARNDTIDLRGQNTYVGTTIVRTNVKFYELRNFGDGAISFDTTTRTLTYGEGNTADITKTVLGSARSVSLGVDTIFDTGANSVTMQNAISGGGKLLKTGSGVMTLLGANTFQGVSIRDGDVVVGNNLAAGGRTKSLEVGGFGNEVGLELLQDTQLEVLNLSLNGTGQISFHLNSASPEATKIAVFGSLAGTGVYTIDIKDSEMLAGAEYTLLAVAGSSSAVSFSLENGVEGTLDWNQGTGVLKYTSVPEPSSSALILVSIGITHLFCRRKIISRS